MNRITSESEPQVRHSGPFGQVPTAAIFDKRLSAESVRLLSALTTHADKYGECFPRQESLAYALDVSQSTISRWLNDLITYEYVKVIGIQRFGVRSWRYRYQIQYQPPKPQNVTQIEDMHPEDILSEDILPAHNKNIYKSSLEHNHIKRERTQAAPTAATPSLSLLQGDLYEALCAALRTRPIGDGARETWRIGIAQMRAEGITPQDIPRAVELYRQKFGADIPCHPKALMNNWSAIGAPVNGGKPYATDTAQAGGRASATPTLTPAERDAWLASLLDDGASGGTSA